MAANTWKQDIYEKAKKNCTQWLRDTMNHAPRGISHPNALSSNAFANRREVSREIMSERLVSIMQIVHTQSEYINQLESEAQQLKSNLIEKQERVIKLQEELIIAKNEPLRELKETVVSSVKTELKSYSEVVQESVNEVKASAAGSSFDRNMLKSVVKDAVTEEDLGKNVVIFGLEEDADEQICEKVGQVLLELGERPKIEANRMGLKVKNQNPRPVKVSVSSSIIVAQILRRAKNLRDSENYKTVFINPDRTLEQRSAHRELVKQLKLKRNQEKDKRHYIKNGQIYSSDKTAE